MFYCHLKLFLVNSDQEWKRRTFATPTTFFALKLQRLVENWPVVNGCYRGEWDSLTSSNLSSGAVTESASLLGAGLLQSGQADLSIFLPANKTFFPLLTLTACHALTHKVVKTFYNCKQIIRVWLKSTLACTWTGNKKRKPKVSQWRKREKGRQME